MGIARRIVQARVAGRAFTGEGARRYGGRWNSNGVAVVYTAGSTSLAILEVLVHIPTYDILDEYVHIPVEFDNKFVLALNPDELPAKWDKDPSPHANKQIGDSWVGNQRSLILELPSVIVPTEKNFLINPAHPDFSKLKIGEPQRFEFDPRRLKF